MQFIKVLRNLIIDGADEIENVCSIDVKTWISREITVCESACMKLLYHLLRQSRQSIKVLKNSTIDGADKIENMCSIDVTP